MKESEWELLGPFYVKPKDKCYECGEEKPCLHAETSAGAYSGESICFDCINKLRWET